MGDGVSVADLLAAAFARRGYVRRQNSTRFADHGSAKYKKGDEVRLVADSEAELETIRELLVSAGFRPGKPYAQGRQLRQPVYGRREVQRFLRYIGADEVA